MQKTQCDTCAFLKGSETHEQEPQNRLRGMLCELGGIPFLCHEGFDWKDPEVQKLPRSIVQQLGGKPCAGWAQAVKKLAERGYFKTLLKEKKVYATEGLKLLELYLRKDIEEEKKVLVAELLKDVVLSLSEAAGFTEVKSERAAISKTEASQATG